MILYGLSWLTALRVQASKHDEVYYAYNEDQKERNEAP